MADEELRFPIELAAPPMLIVFSINPPHMNGVVTTHPELWATSAEVFPWFSCVAGTCPSSGDGVEGGGWQLSLRCSSLDPRGFPVVGTL